MKTTYILVERTPDGNGQVEYHETEIAVSTDRDTLVKYCKTELHSDIGRKKDNMWATYYEIGVSKLLVLTKEERA